MLFLFLFSLAALCGAQGAWAGQDSAALIPIWVEELGPAYSRIATDGEVAVTQYSDGEQDFVVALGVADGRRKWRYELGPTYRGHDGSEDGPVSTPVIGPRAVFAIGPHGKLVGLDLEEGKLLWSRELQQDFAAAEPEYGFATSPLLEQGRLIVQVGGSSGRMLCAFDPASGELLWTQGEGEVEYQSPVMLELLGRRQILVLNGRELLGLEPATGEPLWSHLLAENERASSGSAGQLDGERFFLFVGGELAVFRVSSTEQGPRVEELYRTRELGGTYAKPVYRAGYLYGFRSSFLTCIDASTGKRVWKSRPPGGRGLALMGDRLVVFGSLGKVVLVRATPEGYVEEAAVQVFDRSGYTWPTVFEDRVFVRNDSRLACLAIGTPDDQLADAPSTALQAAGVSGEFARFVEELAALPDRAARDARVDRFLAETPSLPMIEGDWVHFVYVGEATDVALLGSMNGPSGPSAMERVVGTNLFQRSERIEPGARWEYTFQVDFGFPELDPRNPRSVVGRWPDAVSEVVTAGYVPALHTAEPESERRGRLEEIEHTSASLGHTRRLSVYLPVGYDAGSASYPLLLVHDGPEWLAKGRLRNALDNLIGESVAPLVAVFVEPHPDAWFESGGSMTEPYVDMLALELVPFLAARYRLSERAADRALMGTLGFGLTAAFGVVAHPEVFSGAAIQSVALDDVAQRAFFEQLATSPPEGGRFYVDWNLYERMDPDRGYDRAAEGRRFFDALRAAGFAVQGGVVPDSQGWTSWSTRSKAWLEMLFPL